MRLTDINESLLTDEIIERLLFDSAFRYSGETADIILVLGSRKGCKHRVPAAAEIFFSGGAPLMLLSGGKVQDTPLGRMAEHLAMQKAAEALGVPREDIITEQCSLTTEENLFNSRELLRENYPDCKKIILVTADHHMRRALLMAQRFMDGYIIIPAAAASGSCTAAGWKLTEKGRRTAREEALKLGWYARRGRIENILL